MKHKTLPRGTLVWVHNPGMSAYEEELIKEHGPIWVVSEYGSAAYICNALTTGFEWAWYIHEVTTEGEDNASAS